MPRTVLSIVSTLRRCGPISVLEGIVTHLNAASYKAVVVTLFRNPNDSILREFQQLGVRVVEMNMSRAACLAGGRRRLRNVMKALDSDLVHAHGFWANGIVGASSLEVPRISTIHAQLMNDYQMAHGKVLGAWFGHREYAALRNFDRVAAVSEAAAEAASLHGVECEVILNGIDVSRFRPPIAPVDKVGLRERLKLPHRPTMVLHTGTLNSLKQPIDVVAGFLRSRLSQDAVLVFAGDGPLRDQCHRAAGGSTNVVFLGNRLDIPDLLRASDVLISNSRSEGMPMALLEGCASGVHVVASDIAPHRRIQETFGEQVSLYKGHRPEDVAAALDGEDPGSLAKAVKPSQEALTAFSSPRMSQDYQALYDHVLARS